MTAPNAYDYPGIYFDLGIDLNRLATVMLDLKPIRGISKIIDTTACVPYSSPEEDQFWIDGAVGERSAHLTLLHGLFKNDIHLAREVMRPWKPEPITINHIEIFPFDGYACIVARAELTENLLEAHTRLSLLPHIDLFPEYKPHVTLAYVSGDEDRIEDLRDQFSYLVGKTLEAHRINYDGE